MGPGISIEEGAQLLCRRVQRTQIIGYVYRGSRGCTLTVQAYNSLLLLQVQRLVFLTRQQLHRGSTPTSVCGVGQLSPSPIGNTIVGIADRYLIKLVRARRWLYLNLVSPKRSECVRDAGQSRAKERLLAGKPLARRINLVTDLFSPVPAVPSSRTPRSKQHLDADLQRAIELSLAESQPGGSTYVPSEPPLVAKNAVTVAEDDDEEMRMAIAASLAEMDKERPSAPHGLEEPEYKVSLERVYCKIPY
jgi:hypothetical protein